MLFVRSVTNSFRVQLGSMLVVVGYLGSMVSFVRLWELTSNSSARLVLRNCRVQGASMLVALGHLASMLFVKAVLGSCRL